MLASTTAPTSTPRGADGMSVNLSERWLVASFSSPVRACSWAIVGGGLVEIEHVAWREVRDAELRPPINARDFMLERLHEKQLARAVGLLTSRSVATYCDVVVEGGGARARCVATVGLGNALRAGDPAGIAGRIGTINILVYVNVPLSNEALLEASAVATEAKTAVVLEAGILSRRTGRAATGTGTDCTVAACATGLSFASYAGKHTNVGSLIGAAAARAVSDGVTRWLGEQAR